MAGETNEPAASQGSVPGQGEPGETPEGEVQESAEHGARMDDALKRIVKQHPQRGIPQVEGVEPRDAPPKE